MGEASQCGTLSPPVETKESRANSYTFGSIEHEETKSNLRRLKVMFADEKGERIV